MIGILSGMIYERINELLRRKRWGINKNNFCFSPQAARNLTNGD